MTYLLKPANALPDMLFDYVAAELVDDLSTAIERLQGVALGTAELRRTLWDEEA